MDRLRANCQHEHLGYMQSLAGPVGRAPSCIILCPLRSFLLSRTPSRRVASPSLTRVIPPARCIVRRTCHDNLLLLKPLSMTLWRG